MNEPVAGLNARNPWSWYPVVATKDLEPGKVMPVVLNGERLVVWRSQSGRANAWSDRCPHRGMRLSLGAVHREELICPYHGWTFGTDGHCNRIPAHPNTEPSRAARSRLYPSTESDGYVWVCIGEPASETPKAGTLWPPVRSLHLPVDVPEATAALLIVPLDANGADPGPINPDALTWSLAATVVRVSARLSDESTFTAVVRRGGALTATLEGPRGTTRYAVQFQPAEHGACVVQLASGAEPRAINRSLVAFRHDLIHEIDAATLAAVRSKLAESLPDRVQG